MITAERLAEIAVYGRDAMPMKAELLELVNAYRVDYSDLQRQLAEANEMLEGFERAHSIVVNALNKAEAEIEAMRPVVEKVSAYRIKLIAYSPAVLGSECVTAQTEMFKALDEYEASKQP